MAEPWFKDGLRFECTQCGKCCGGSPGYVWVNDEEIAELAKFLGEPVEAVFGVYTRREGSKRSLREKLNYDCIFYDREKGCTVYPVRPRQLPHLAVLGCEYENGTSLGPDGRRLPRVQSGGFDSIGRNSQTHSGDSHMNPELEARVREIYASADRAVAVFGPKCDASGRCCRFTEYGHTLFISQLEADVLLAQAPSYDKPVTRDFCPFQVENLCTARDSRPLGCRVYFCDPAYEATGQEISESHLAKLKALADELKLPWRYAPLHVFLNEGEGTGPKPETGGKIGLPMVGE